MSKPELSVITTSQGGQPSRIGTQLGAHGLATLVGMAELPKHPSPELALDMMACLPAFSALLPSDQVEVDQTREAICYLETPATRKWIAGRVVTLLSHYFVAQTDVSVAEAVAEDWCVMLSEYPAWAVSNACRWWMGRENQRKHCKPLPGDIQARAHVETERLRAARITLSRGIRPQNEVGLDRGRSPDWSTPEAIERRRVFAQETMRAIFGAGRGEGAAE